MFFVLYYITYWAKAIFLYIFILIKPMYNNGTEI